MPGLPVVFFIMAAVAIGTAAGMVISRNTVYSAMFLVLNFATVAMLYLILGAPFIALSQITVYAGSIMVLFLFVIMLLGVERMPDSANLRWLPVVAIPLLGVLLAVLGLTFFNRMGSLAGAADVSSTFGAPNEIGALLFTQYTLPFEITGVILLTAVIGAIILAKADHPSARDEARAARLAADASSKKDVPAGAQHD